MNADPRKKRSRNGCDRYDFKSERFSFGSGAYKHTRHAKASAIGRRVLK